LVRTKLAPLRTKDEVRLDSSFTPSYHHNAGLGFIFLQTLSYNGYIKIDQERVKESVEGLLDLNHDGKIDEKDTAIAYKKIMKVLSYELPAGSGFVAGFAGGVRSG